MFSLSPSSPCPALYGGTCPGPSCPHHAGISLGPVCPATYGDKCSGPYCPVHGMNATPPVCPGNSTPGGVCPGLSCPVHSPAAKNLASDRRAPRVFREIKDDRLVLYIGRDDARGKPAKMILTLTSPKVVDQRLCTSSVGVQADSSVVSKEPSGVMTGRASKASRSSEQSGVATKKKKATKKS